MRQVPPFRLVPEPLDDDAQSLPGFKWAGPEVGHRHLLGGRPPNMTEQMCSLGHTMTFYAQIDSINDEFSLADAGVIHVHVCFECFETKAILIST